MARAASAVPTDGRLGVPLVAAGTVDKWAIRERRLCTKSCGAARARLGAHRNSARRRGIGGAGPSLSIST
jgi:hypothetical protein